MAGPTNHIKSKTQLVWDYSNILNSNELLILSISTNSSKIFIKKNYVSLPRIL